jgi:hypothetical protein
MNISVDYEWLRNNLLECMELIGRLPACINSGNGKDTQSILETLRRKLIDVGDLLRLDVVNVIRIKIRLNELKYPVRLCQGTIQKYTAYSGITGVTKESGQTIFGIDNINPRLLTFFNDPHLFYSELPVLQEEVIDFTTLRGWESKDTPRNLLFALHSEFAELCQLFQWKLDTRVPLPISDKDWDKVAQEVSDVFIYSFKLSRAIGSGI